MAWHKDYLSIAFTVIAVHLLPWAFIALIAYCGYQLAMAIIACSLAAECTVWYNMQKQRARNYLGLLMSKSPNWDIEKSIKEYLEYVGHSKR